MARKTRKPIEFTLILDPEKYADAIDQLESKLGKKITHEQVAQLIGISRAHLDYLRRGKAYPSVRVMAKMASIFNCKIDDLFTIIRTGKIERTGN